MTASYAYDDQPPQGHPLLPGAAPQDIRAALQPEDRGEFDTAYGKALTEARSSLDLTELFKTLEQWRRLAVLQSDPEGYRRMLASAETARQTHTLPAGSVPWSQLKSELGL